MSPKRGGFTLIELMVVVTIIGVLISLMFPIYSTAMRSVQETNCQGNLAQLAKVMAAYCQANNGYFPFCVNKQGNPPTLPSASDWLFVADSDDKINLTCRTELVSNRAGEMQEGLLVKNKLIGRLESFYCPTDMDLGLVRGPASAYMSAAGTPNLDNYLRYTLAEVARPATSYVVNNAITNGEFNFPSEGRRVRKLSDFSPSTFLFFEESSGDTEHGEKPSLCNRGHMGGFPQTNNPGERNLTARHRGGGHIACMDGHVEWMMYENPDDINDPSTFVASRKLLTTKTGEQGKGQQWYFTTGTRWGP